MHKLTKQTKHVFGERDTGLWMLRSNFVPATGKLD